MKFTKRIFNRKPILLISIFLLFTILSLSGIVSAHNPTDMVLSFDTSTKGLDVIDYSSSIRYQYTLC